MTPDAIAALNRRDDRQDQRLDNHGERLGGLERREAVRDEQVRTLTKSVDHLTNAIYAAAVAIIGSAAGVIYFGGG